MCSQFLNTNANTNTNTNTNKFKSLNRKLSEFHYKEEEGLCYHEKVLTVEYNKRKRRPGVDAGKLGIYNCRSWYFYVMYWEESAKYESTTGHNLR